MKTIYKKNKAFTLIEIIVSITILSVILMSVFSIYTNLIAINKRLQVIRVVQENARSITETIASDIREKGIDMSYYDSTSSDKSLNYSGSGSRVLAIKGSPRILYYAMKDTSAGPIQCSDDDIKTLSIHCYMGKEEGAQREPLSGDHKRVRIYKSNFFVNGDTTSVDSLSAKSAKATIILSLGIESTAGITSDIAKASNVEIQTTISEKVYKN